MTEGDRTGEPLDSCVRRNDGGGMTEGDRTGEPLDSCVRRNDGGGGLTRGQPLSKVLPATGIPPGKPFPLAYDGPCVDFQTPAHEVATTLYDFYGDCKRMMKLLDLPEAMRAGAFDQLRHDYPKRREFAVSPVVLRHGTREITDRFNALGIPCSQA